MIVERQPGKFTIEETPPRPAAETRALVLSGGGSRGAWQVGAIRELLVEERLSYDIYCGVSVGALNAAHLAQYPTGQEADAARDLEALWRSIDTSSVRRDWAGGLARGLLTETGLYSSEPLRGLIAKHLDQDRIRSSGKRLRIGAVSRTTGQYCTFTEVDGYLAQAVLASSAFPALLESVQWFEHQWWTDGGVRNIVPLQDAIDAGATVIDVLCSQAPLIEWSRDRDPPSVIEGALRDLEILLDEILRADLERRISACAPAVIVTVLRPSSPLPGAPLDFEPADIAEMIARGAANQRRVLDREMETSDELVDPEIEPLDDDEGSGSSIRG